VEAAHSHEGRAAEERPGRPDALGQAAPALAAARRLRDEAEHEGDSEAVGFGARRCRDAEGVTLHCIFTDRSPFDSRARGENGSGMNVAVVDVGSNTIRLLVAARSPRGLVCVARGMRAVRLGADVERFGAVSAAKLAEAADALQAFGAIADAAGASALDVVVASPGRQARNAEQLVHVLSRAAGVPVRVLSQDDEARLAFEGALAWTQPAGAVAVCDVGGGSTQVAVGTAAGGPAWLRSVDLGSLRLSARIPCSDPPVKAQVAALRAEARAALERLTPPLPSEAIAVGGTARALKRLVGRTLGEDELKAALRLVRKVPARELAARYGVEVWRARALPAGAAIMLELQRLLGVPLEACRGGLREGVALERLDRFPAVQAGGGR
jgi:exopolyphosphatase / guanosine-5'-triphosphate,3'-diphosphate pyrophosphatase